MRKHGQRNFLFEVIEECSLEEIDERESYWIAVHNSVNKLNGYNVSAGGQGKSRQSKLSLLINNLEEIVKSDNVKEKILSEIENIRESNVPSQSKEHIEELSRAEQKLTLSLISFFCHYAVDDIMLIPLDTWLSFAAFEISDAYTFKKNKQIALDILTQKGWWSRIKTNVHGDIVDKVPAFSCDEKYVKSSNYRKFTWSSEEDKLTALQFFDICRFYLQQSVE